MRGERRGLSLKRAVAGLLGLGLLAAGAALGVRDPALADAGPQRGALISRGSAPFADSWRAMLSRDNRIRAEIAAGLRPAPAPLQAIPHGILPRKRHAGTLEGVFQAPGETSGEDAPQTIGTNFRAVSLQDQFDAFGSGSFPPDTHGAIGQSHFVEIINGSVAVFSRTGTRLSFVSLNSFFTFASGGVTFPRTGAFDPRILFDRPTGRFFASTLEFGSPARQANHVILAISRTSDATGAWDKYLIPVGVPAAGGTTFFTDYQTLGVDANGVYFGMTIFGSTGGASAKIAATPKAPLIAATPSLGQVFAFSGLTDLFSSPQPAHNPDALAATGRAWFLNSSTTDFFNVLARSLTWAAGVPTLSATTTITTPAYADTLDAPAMGSTARINTGDDRIQGATLRNNRVWVSRNVGVNGTGGNTTPDRMGCEWLELDVAGAAPTLVQSGRIFDPSASDPRFYYYPSIMVNGQGEAAVGFSGSKAAEFVGAYTCGRLPADPAGTMRSIALIKAGEGSYTRQGGDGRNRWGDYSYTSLDPTDDRTFWTIQEYATATPNIWGTWVAQLLASSPGGGGTLNVASTLSFGRVTRRRSKTKSLVITNQHATQSLQITVGTPVAPFTIVSGGGSAVLPPNGTHTVRIKFRPTKRKSYTSNLPITSSDPAKPNVNVALSGRGR